LNDGLFLQQIAQNPDPEFFIQKGVKRGIAHRFVSDIEYWVKRQKVAVQNSE